LATSVVTTLPETKTTTILQTEVPVFLSLVEMQKAFLKVQKESEEAKQESSMVFAIMQKMAETCKLMENEHVQAINQMNQRMQLLKDVCINFNSLKFEQDKEIASLKKDLVSIKSTLKRYLGVSFDDTVVEKQ
jgi:hypothetical protein